MFKKLLNKHRIIGPDRLCVLCIDWKLCSEFTAVKLITNTVMQQVINSLITKTNKNKPI